jgi:hypothetical protein
MFGKSEARHPIEIEANELDHVVGQVVQRSLGLLVSHLHVVHVFILPDRMLKHKQEKEERDEGRVSGRERKSREKQDK